MFYDQKNSQSRTHAAIGANIPRQYYAFIGRETFLWVLLLDAICEKSVRWKINFLSFNLRSKVWYRVSQKTCTNRMLLEQLCTGSITGLESVFGRILLRLSRIKRPQVISMVNFHSTHFFMILFYQYIFWDTLYNKLFANDPGDSD